MKPKTLNNPTRSVQVTPKEIPFGFHNRFELKPSLMKGLKRTDSCPFKKSAQPEHSIGMSSDIEYQESPRDEEHVVEAECEKVEEDELTVYGDSFDPDTRTILVLLRIAGTEFKFKEIDRFQNQHKHNDYLIVNPLGEIPCIDEGNFKVMGKTKVFLSYLGSTQEKLSDLYPKSKQAQLDQYMNWFESVLRPSARRISKILMIPK